MSVEADVWLVGELLREKVGLNLPSNKISGFALVDWLVKNDDQIWSREDGVKLCRLLVEYRVLQHEEEKLHFADEYNRFYRFSCDAPNSVYPQSQSERRTWCQGLEVMRQFNLEQNSARKRRTSFLAIFGKDKQSPQTFKGKNLIEWLERRTDFENREDCKRFVKCLLKLDFIRSSHNDVRMNEAGDYWFYPSSLAEPIVARRKISRERKTVAEPSFFTEQVEGKRRISELGITTEFMEAVTKLQKVHDRRDERIRLKDSCEVLSSKSASRESMLSAWEGVMGLSRDWSREFQRQHRVSSNYDTSSSFGATSSYMEEEDSSTWSYVNRLAKQFPASTPSCLHRTRNVSECSSTFSDLADSPEFQQQLANLSASSRSCNYKEVQKEKAAILEKLQIQKFGLHSSTKASGTPVQRDDSTESRATKSSGYWSIDDSTCLSSPSDRTSPQPLLQAPSCPGGSESGSTDSTVHGTSYSTPPPLPPRPDLLQPEFTEELRSAQEEVSVELALLSLAPTPSPPPRSRLVQLAQSGRTPDNSRLSVPVPRRRISSPSRPVLTRGEQVFEPTWRETAHARSPSR